MENSGIENAGKLAYRSLRVGVENRQGTRGIRDYLAVKENKGYVGFIASGINRLTEDYNQTVISDENRQLLLATSKLKEKTRLLPTLDQMYSDLVAEKDQARWLKNFEKAIVVLDSKMASGEKAKALDVTGKPSLVIDASTQSLLFGTSNAHPKAKILALALHAYEEAVYVDKRPEKYRKDEIVDALTEMIIQYHDKPEDIYYPFFKMVRDPESPNEQTAALGWIDNYPNFSSDLRQKAGCK